MAARLYIVPIIGVGTKADPRRPKYFSDGTITESWSGLDYGFEPWMFVGADLSPADDAVIVGEPDAFALPFDLTPNLTNAQVTNVQNKLSAINVPFSWVSTSLTWTQVVRTVFGVFSFVQRYGAVYARHNPGSTPPSIFINGVSLSTQYGSLPDTVRASIYETAQSFGIDTSPLKSTTTIGAILKAVADFFQSQTFIVGPVTV